MFDKLFFWLECSRWYALPMSIFSWFVVFSYALQTDGNVINGIIALVGICFAHLATNLFDDFFDFNTLKKNLDENGRISLPNTQRGKCRYLLDNKVKLKEVFGVVCIYSAIAFLIGLYFYFIGYHKVLWFMLLASFVVITYPVMSNIRLSELMVGIAYGPLLFGGVYYVMTGKLPLEVFILAIPSTIFTINLLFTDMFLDKELDKNEGKKTFVGLFKSDETVFGFQTLLITIAYLSVFLIPIFDIADWEVFFTLLTIPLALDLSKSLKMYSEDKTQIPEKKWFHFPFEDWDDIEKNRSQAFMFRMYQARNLMIYSSIILAVTIWFS